MTQPPRTYADRLMAKARAQVELESIQKDAVEGDLISFEGVKPQFAIRDIFLLTTFTAIVMAAARQFGASMILGAILICGLAWGWYFASGRRRAHDKEIARRLAELSRRHDKEIVDELPLKSVVERPRE